MQIWVKKKKRCSLNAWSSITNFSLSKIMINLWEIRLVPNEIMLLFSLPSHRYQSRVEIKGYITSFIIILIHLHTVTLCFVCVGNLRCSGHLQTKRIKKSILNFILFYFFVFRISHKPFMYFRTIFRIFFLDVFFITPIISFYFHYTPVLV